MDAVTGTTTTHDHAHGIRWARLGLIVNALLAAIKFAAGVLGNSYALIADAVESTADIAASLIVIGGLRIAAQPADADHPYGHGRAETLAAAVVALMLLAAAVGIAVKAVAEIRTPHHSPAPWTLVVLVVVVSTKWLLAKKVKRVGVELGSGVVDADASHHLSDAITSAAAFIGIAIAILAGPGWESADDWAALLASSIIFYNGLHLLKPAVDELMDRMPAEDLVRQVGDAALATSDVRAIEKLGIRRTGTSFHVDLHVQADPEMSLHDAHILSGRVKGAIRAAVPRVSGVLIHMEPHEPPRG